MGLRKLQRSVQRTQEVGPPGTATALLDRPSPGLALSPARAEPPKLPITLVDFLQRLSPKERSDLIARRLEDQQASFDDHKLARTLAHPAAVSQVLDELNAFQLLVLRWLAAQPDFGAPWVDFLRELHGRAPEDYLSVQMENLRRWGVADYEPALDGGFVATFEVVADTLSLSTFKLPERLPYMGMDYLRTMCRTVGLLPPPRSRAEAVQGLAAAMRQPSVVSHLVKALPGPVRELFQWVRDEGGRVSAHSVAQRLGDTTPSRRATSPWRSPAVTFHQVMTGSGPLSQLAQRCLLVPVSPYGAHPSLMPSAYAIPQEVEQSVAGASAFEDAQVLPPRLASAPDVLGRGLSLPFFLRDLVHLLGFITSGQCEWRQDGQPYERSFKRFAKMAGMADAGYPSLLWQMALDAGLVESAPGHHGFQDALPQRMDQGWLLTALVNGWATGSILDDEETWVQVWDRKPLYAIRGLQRIPADTWITRESFHRFLTFAWPRLFGAGRPDGSSWEARFWERASHLVAEAGAGTDGQAVFRIPAALQKFLRGDQQAIGDVLPPWEEHWTVQADRSVIAPPNLHPAALMDLWRVAELESNAGTSVFRLTRQSVARALNQGMRPEQLLKLLREGSRTTVPATVEALINDQAKRYGRLRVGDAAAYVYSDDPALLETVMRERGLAGLSWRQVSPGVVCVQGTGAGELMDMLRKAGHLPVLDNAPREKPAAQAGRPSPAGPKRRGRRRRGWG